MSDRKKAIERKQAPSNTWSLQAAKARLSEVVRLAQTKGPQRVTVHGRDAVVIVDAAEYERLQPSRTGQALIDLLAHSPFREVNLDLERVRVPVQPRDLDFGD